MLFHMHNKKVNTLTPKIINTIIEKVEEFNFLGLTLDTHVNWKKHTEKVSNKCSRIIGILNRLKHNLPQRIKLMLYNSLLLPHINYCLTTWGYHCHRLQKLQKRAIRIITLSKYNDHTAPLFKKLNLLTIKDIFALQELKLYYKFIHNNVHHTFSSGRLNKILIFTVTTLAIKMNFTLLAQNMPSQSSVLKIICPIPVP